MWTPGKGKRIEVSLEGISWEKRFMIAWACLLKMEHRAEDAERRAERAEARLALYGFKYRLYQKEQDAKHGNT